MFVIRPIAEKDEEALAALAFEAFIGITSLPKNKELLRKKIKTSISAFAAKDNLPKDEAYLFVLENIENQQVVGVSGIYSKTGIDAPCYYYCQETIFPKKSQLPISDEIPILRPISIKNDPSEICALFLARSARKEGLGRLLSLSRFMFMAVFPNRFDEEVIASLRGIIDSDQKAPFWEGVGRHFFKVDFAEVLKMLEKGWGFIPEILPEYPIYLSLLPREVQEVIGKTYPNTKPALEMLQKEGFETTRYIDIFDAGPIIKARRLSIRTVREAKKAVVKVSHNAGNGRTCLISNAKMDFRACFAEVEVVNNKDVKIHHDVAKALQIADGDFIYYTVASRGEKQ